MRIEFTLTAEDLDEVQQLQRMRKDLPVLRASQLRRQSSGILLWFFFIAMAIGWHLVRARTQHVSPPPTTATISTKLSPRTPWQNLPFILVGLFFVFFLLRRIFSGSKGARMFKTGSSLQSPQTFEITDEGITQFNSVAKVTWAWHAFPDVLEGPRVIILPMRQVNGQLSIPKRAIPSGQLEQLKALLRRHIPGSIQSFSLDG
jgi:YcxB-like protein